ncbi:unnamed protein product [Zymoseptoria tritici ST99CH_1A5]|uniref:AAA+ ATPase domain-containing protein n=3 Tax=Zymoseptoria tritici TaxID=1047171 RepID=A0A1X7RKB2_ZYMT9|nr:unnamed protein product [Zymoseptoria tritici ST99CH_3D7]SMR46190.1 unnamed protein product [Zymoseptoria tritici ST99CH_1E4]SMR47442.1 unnamed protein product [Zymoseptoria tritici ST99CH_3D1]SMY21340.1 unnamed protein product [Zymoseptoria tritici ST99CH_1A5]
MTATNNSTSAPPSTAASSSPSSPRKISKASTAMPAATNLHVVVRLLPSNGLEGAFRVHVQPESLDQASLKLGEVCEIVAEDGCLGYGIAWRADDRMGNRPKNRPIKMTETIRTAFGFQEGSRVTIARTDIQIWPADRIVLTDITPKEYLKTEAEDDKSWSLRIGGVLVNCEVLTSGIEFDVVGRRKAKKRFYIENIEAAAAPNDAGVLFTVDDRTEFIFSDGSSIVHSCDNAVKTNGSRPTTSTRLHFDNSKIAGLIEQSQQLNKQLELLLSATEKVQQGAQDPRVAVLLHGYEGTGKTLLLDTLAKSNFRKVVRLQKSTLNGGTISKNQAIIRESFQDAKAHQPSLILMDNLDKMAPSDDAAYGDVLASELAGLANTQVLAVGATRNLSDLSNTIIGPEQFAKVIELPIPDVSARSQILNVLQGLPLLDSNIVSTEIAARTHGFTGQDVAWLYKLALNHAATRDEQTVQNSTHAITSDSATTTMPSLPSPPSFSVTISDFNLALKEITPAALREIFTEKPKISWSDIGGSRDVAESFDEIIGWSLHSKDKLEALNVRPPKGVLLYGPPGCSKTLTAQAVASTYNFNFIVVKGAELLSMYVGESERAVREVFRKARAAAPCVIFFDEIDSIGGDRGDSSGGTKGLNVLTTLLNEMDGFDSLKDVLILAATNRPDVLDPALMRPGRFDSHVYLGPPDAAARWEIFKIALRNVPQSADVDLEELVMKTIGYSGAEIVKICGEAKFAALRRHLTKDGHGEAEPKVRQKDLEAGRESTKRLITEEMVEGYRAFGARGKE